MQRRARIRRPWPKQRDDESARMTRRKPMRASPILMLGAVALALGACNAATAVRAPEASGFSGYDRVADREFRMPSEDSWFYTKQNREKAAKVRAGSMQRKVGKDHKDGMHKDGMYVDHDG